jgi:hypothetical protein
MNKKVITFFATAGMIAGGYVPVMFGWDPTGLNGLSILGGLVGGFLGIWLGVVASRYA